MTPEELWQKVRAVLKALENLSPEQRAEELKRVRQTEPEVASEVERLLDGGYTLPIPPPGSFPLERLVADAWEQVLRAEEDSDRSPPSIQGYDLPGGDENYKEGGMGVVHFGTETALKRRVAVKLLRRAEADRTDSVARFNAEAQICAQLEHPSIVPVHQVGCLPDGRPYFVMKLVNGETLAQLLRKRVSGAAELISSLSHFRRVCDAMAYAHSMGVLHRDLKPGNVMVGEFGEVQVMDWGLAKVIREGKIHTDGFDKTVGWSQKGTPAYMAPEQAQGAVSSLDERCDVFGLGAILCKILTGEPPWRGETPEEVVGKAARADLSDAFGRLNGCGADPELVKLTKKWLAKEKADRPSNAGAAAEELTAYLAGLQDRLRKADIERAEAQARARVEKEKRRMTRALAVVVVLTVIGGGAAAVQQLMVEYAQDEKVENLLTQAKTQMSNPEEWGNVLAEARNEWNPGNWMLWLWTKKLGQDLDAADRDHALVVQLEDAQFRLTPSGRGRVDKEGASALFAAAFRQDDRDWDSLQPAEAAARVNNRREIRDQLLAALEDWACADESLAAEALAPALAAEAPLPALVDWAVVTSNLNEAQRLRLIVLLADPNPASLRNRWEGFVMNKDWKAVQQAAEADKEAPAAVCLAEMGGRLIIEGKAGEAFEFLRAATGGDPKDFWTAFRLATASENDIKDIGTGNAGVYYALAMMLRPKCALVHYRYGIYLRNCRLRDPANQELARALKLRSDLCPVEARLELGQLLVEQAEEAEVEDAQGSARKERIAKDAMNWCDVALRFGLSEEESDEAHYYLGKAWMELGDFDQALEEFRKGHVEESNKWFIDAKGQRDLDLQLRDIRSGKVSPEAINPGRRLPLASFCLKKRNCFLLAARLYAAAFGSDPMTPKAMRENRFNAACAAAMAGCGKGEDKTADKDEMRRRRMQALEWLKADLELCAKDIESRPDEMPIPSSPDGPAATEHVGGQLDARTEAAARLESWTRERCLDGVRAASLKKDVSVSDDELRDWITFWKDVDTLLQKARAK